MTLAAANVGFGDDLLALLTKAGNFYMPENS